MKNRKKMLVFIILLMIVISFCGYYYYPRKVPFVLTKVIDKPNESFNRAHEKSYDYIKNEKYLIGHLVDYYKKSSCVENLLCGYDSLFVQNIKHEFDFDKYDYLITYHKKLKGLVYSPYLAKKHDRMGYFKEKPLIPTFDTEITDKVYFYRIEKNNKYRAPGP